ncbi:hypothetical protein SLA2020_389990 [Shorea laevis]
MPSRSSGAIALYSSPCKSLIGEVDESFFMEADPGAVQSISTRKGVETGSSKVPEDLSEAAGRVPKRVQVCC